MTHSAVGTRIHQIVSWCLVWQIAIGPGLASSASPHPSGPPSAPLQPWVAPNDTAPPAPIDTQFLGSDPLLDEDPFFLRSQSWEETQGESSADDPEYRVTPTGMEVRVGNSVWKLGQALKPLASTEEHLILTAQRKDFFENKLGGDLTESFEGIFFVSWADFDEAAHLKQAKRSIPVYFLPLPSNGWSGDGLSAHRVLEAEITMLQREDGFLLPLLDEDLALVETAGKFNLTLGIFTAIKSKTLSKDEILLPARGSTAGFGTLATGMDLDRIEGASIDHRSQLSNPHPILVGLFNALVPNAQAQDETDPTTAAQVALDNAKLYDRLIWISTVLAFTLVGAVVLRYTIYKERFDNEIKGDGTSLPTARQRVGTHARQVIDVYAHALAVLFQLPTITTVNAVEFFLDRYVPTNAAGQNSLIRRFFERTFGYARRVLQGTPVNSTTWFYGSIIQGGIDTLFVALQLVVVNGWIANQMATVLPGLRTRVDQAFDPGNPVSNNFLRNEVMRNLFSYSTHGAVGYAQELQGQVEQKADGIIDAKLRAEGKDPQAPEHRSEREKLKDEIIRREMDRLNLPPKEAFLFDFTTLWNQALALLGYRLPEEAHTNSIAYMGESRPGLILAALDRAIEYLESRTSTETTELDALIFLYEARTKAINLIGFIELVLSRPTIEDFATRFREAQGEFIETRNMLLAFTYEGTLEFDPSKLPEHWKARLSKPERRLAGMVFRRAFLALAKGDPTILEGVSTADRERFDIVARMEARTLVPESGALQDHVFERILHDQVAQAKASETTYTPPQHGWFERWQFRRALKTTNRAYFRKYNEPFNPVTAVEAQARFFRDAYARALNEIVGLYPDYREFPDLENRIERIAQVAVSTQLSDAKLKAHLKALEPLERELFVARLYAGVYATVYLDETARGTLVPATSPTQPGAWQSLRQTEIVRNSRLLTRLFRTFEALNPETEVRPGIEAWIYRNVPGLHDAWMANVRTWYRFPVLLTSSYLFNRFFWQADITWQGWFWFILWNWTIGGPMQSLNRFFTNQGWQPMGNVPLFMFQSFLYTWATFFGGIPIFVFMGDFTAGMQWITSPVGLSTLTGLSAAVAAGQGLTTVYRDRCSALLKRPSQ